MPVRKAMLEPKSQAKRGAGALSQQLGVLAGGPRMGYSIPFEEATEARCSGHLLMCAWSFQREKLPKAKHFIQI